MHFYRLFAAARHCVGRLAHPFDGPRDGRAEPTDWPLRVRTRDGRLQIERRIGPRSAWD